MMHLIKKYRIELILSTLFLIIHVISLASGEIYLWYDELATITEIQYDLVWRYFQYSNHPPLYFFCLHILWNLITESHLILKLFSIAISAIFIFIYAKDLRKLFGSVVAMLATLLLILSPPFFYFSQEIRPYPLVILLGWHLLTTFSRELLEERKNKTKRFFILGVLCFYSSYILGSMLILCGAIYFLIHKKYKKQWDFEVIKGIFAAGLVFIPWFMGAGKAISLSHFSRGLEELSPAFIPAFTNNTLYNINFSFVLSSILLISGGAYLFQLRTRSFQKEDYFIGHILIFSAAIFSVFFIKTKFFSISNLMADRYLAWWGPVLFSLIALLLHRLSLIRMKWIALIGLSVFFSGDYIASLNMKTFYPDKYNYGKSAKNVIHHIQKNSAKKEKFFFYPYVFNRKFLLYIFDQFDGNDLKNLMRSSKDYPDYVNCDPFRWNQKDISHFVNSEMGDTARGAWVMFSHKTIDCGPGGEKRIQELQEVLLNLKMEKEDESYFGPYILQKWMLK